MTDLPEVTRYELPEGGISLFGYVVRRMHKTELLESAVRRIMDGRSAEALLDVACYAAAASTSFGPAYYQPTFNAVGEEITEVDPATGAMVSATLVGRTPHYDIRSQARLLGGVTFQGRERILGTTFGLRGLGMPAPSEFEFSTAGGANTARLRGTVTSELVPGLFRRTRIRAFGLLEFSDSREARGTLSIDRSGRSQASVLAEGAMVERQVDLSTRFWAARPPHLTPEAAA